MFLTMLVFDDKYTLIIAKFFSCFKKQFHHSDNLNPQILFAYFHLQKKPIHIKLPLSLTL